ncbi:MAG: PQQ-binding-like beta-propeller repeat protein [Planctomyces sp.]|nr:PQQ-binding-like beta-propeller repeat protein [Planctomyces sp.]
MSGEGIGGIAVSRDVVVVGSRDIADQHDVFQGFSAEDGQLLWQHFYPASGKLDYGNSPRATPLIDGDYVYTLGAFGDVCCLELETGLVLWQKNIARESRSPALTWGHSGSPLLLDGTLLLQPGGPTAGIVALDGESGDKVWGAPGIRAAYASMLLKDVQGTLQVIGHDEKSLGGWDAKTGKRIWTVTPQEEGDFNVPTCLDLGDHLFIATENNAARLYTFQEGGVLNPDPVAINEDLKPDSHTPVVSNGRIYGIHHDLVCLDPSDGLKTVATFSDNAFGDYGSLVATDSRLLALSTEGELLLFSTVDPQPVLLSRLRLKASRNQVLSHPAFAGTAIYVRLGKDLVRFNLK